MLLGGKIKYIPKEQFEKNMGCEFKEELEVRDASIPKNIRENITGEMSAEKLKKQLENILAHPYRNLVICKINDQVSYGVFAGNPIAKDTVVSFYSGTFMPNVYVDDAKDKAIGYYGLNASFSTTYYRGIGSFFSTYTCSVWILGVIFLSSNAQHVSIPGFAAWDF